MGAQQGNYIKNGEEERGFIEFLWYVKLMTCQELTKFNNSERKLYLILHNSP